MTSMSKFSNMIMEGKQCLFDISFVNTAGIEVLKLS